MTVEVFLLLSVIFLSMLGMSFALVSIRLRLLDKKTRLLYGISPPSPDPDKPVHFLSLSYDVWALFYYLFLITVVVSLRFWGGPFLVILFFAVTFGAVLSIYFILTQVMVRKDSYGLALTSSFIPVLLLGTLFLMAPIADLIELIQGMREGLFVAISILSLSGLILAVASFFTFLSFMDDMSISLQEHKRLSLISDGTIVFLVSLFILSLGCFLVAGSVIEMQVISLSMSIILVSAICEFTKTARVRPALAFLSLKINEHRFEEKELLKRLAFGVEGIAVTSWLFVTFIFFVPMGSIDIFQTIGLYILLVMVSFLLSQLITNR